jgi:hypothetical protein
MSDVEKICRVAASAYPYKILERGGEYRLAYVKLLEGGRAVADYLPLSREDAERLRRLSDCITALLAAADEVGRCALAAQDPQSLARCAAEKADVLCRGLEEELRDCAAAVALSYVVSWITADPR